MSEKTKNVATEQVEDYVGVPVPIDKRQKWSKPALVWLGFCFNFANIVIGGQIEKMVGIPNAIFAILLGNLGLFIYAGLIAVASARTGYSFPMQVKAAFGVKGALIPVAILSIFVSWCFAYNSWILTDVFFSVFGGNEIIWCLVVVNLCWIGALKYKNMVTLGKAVVPVIVFLILYFLIGIIIPSGSNALSSSPINASPFMAAFTISLGTFTISGTMTGDIVRYCKKGKDALIVMLVAFFIGNSFCLILGALASAAAPAIDDYFGMTVVLGGIPLLVCTLIAQASTAASCLYNAVSGVCNLSPKITWTKAVITIGVLCSILAATGIISNLSGFFGTVGFVVPPIGGILIADFFFVRGAKGYSEKTPTGINYYALITVVVGVVVSVISSKVFPNFPNQVAGIVTAVAMYAIGGKAALKKLSEEA